jgi:hypothetical protein
MTNIASPPAGHLTISLGEMRAAMAAEASNRNWLAAAVLAALLSLLEALAALLADFKAGRLVAQATLAAVGPGHRVRSAACPTSAESATAARCQAPESRSRRHASRLPRASGGGADRRGCAGKETPTTTLADNGIAHAGAAGANAAAARKSPHPDRSAPLRRRREHHAFDTPFALLGARVMRGMARKPGFQKIGVEGLLVWCAQFVTIS